MSMELCDEKLLFVLTVCDEYARSQKLLGDKLSSGIFQLLLARKNDTISVNDIRQDFDSRIRLLVNEKTGIGSLIEDGDAIDSLLIFSALPSPALRRAQKSFADSLDIVIKLIKTVNQLQPEIDEIE